MSSIAYPSFSWALVPGEGVNTMASLDQESVIMSMHSSFRGDGGLTKHRNVLKRGERLERLKAEDRWDRSKPVTGLPKVRNIKLK